MAFTSIPTVVARELSEPRLKNAAFLVASCDSFVTPTRTCAKRETFAGSETCGPKENVRMRVRLPFKVP